LSAGRQQLEAAKSRLAQIEAVLGQRDEIEAGWAALQRARADDSAWNARLLRHTQLQEQVNRARLAVVRPRLALESEAESGCPITMPSWDARLRQDKSRRSTWHRRARRWRISRARGASRWAGCRAARGRRAVAALKVESERLKVERQAVRDKMEMMVATEFRCLSAVRAAAGAKSARPDAD